MLDRKPNELKELLILGIGIRERGIKDDSQVLDPINCEYLEEPFTNLEKTDIDRGLKEENKEFYFRYIKFKLPSRQPSGFFKHLLNM